MKRYSIQMILITLFTFAVACEEQGPAEKAGEALDDAVEEGGDGVEDATDEVKDTFDKDGPLEEAAEKVEDSID